MPYRFRNAQWAFFFFLLFCTYFKTTLIPMDASSEHLWVTNEKFLSFGNSGSILSFCLSFHIVNLRFCYRSKNQLFVLINNTYPHILVFLVECFRNDDRKMVKSFFFIFFIIYIVSKSHLGSKTTSVANEQNPKCSKWLALKE